MIRATHIEQVVRQARPVRRHEIDRLHRAQRDDLFVARPSPITPTDLTGRNTAKAWLTVSYEALRAQLSMKMRRRAAAGRRIPLHLAEDAHAKARARERMAERPSRAAGRARADAAHLVLEQLAQRLEQLQVHALRQAADVVMRLDDVGLAGLARRPTR